MAKSAPATIAGMLRRAVAIGVELRRIERDPMLRFLSHEAWLAHARVLAGADLDELRARIADRPHLLATIDQTAIVWLRGSQDRPALAQILDDPEREPGAFSERLAAGLSLAEASGLVAARYAEMAPQGRWGALARWADLDDLVQPLHRELEVLDHELASNTLLQDLAWITSRPHLLVDGVRLPIEQGTVAHIATGLAELAKLSPAGAALAA